MGIFRIFGILTIFGFSEFCDLSKHWVVGGSESLKSWETLDPRNLWNPWILGILGLEDLGNPWNARIIGL